MFIKAILCVLYLSYAIAQELVTDSVDMKFMGETASDAQVSLALAKNFKDELFDVRCFWVKGWNVYDISNLERTNEYSDWNITNASGSIFFNFCTNTHKTCPDTDATVMLGIDTNGACHRMAGNDTKTNSFSLQNSSDPNSGLHISLSNGQICNEDQFYVTTLILDCNATMGKGQIEFYNSADFNVNSCKNVLKGQSAEACPKLNYYIISYFLETYRAFIGIIVIIIGFFLLMFGAKFLKVTVVIVGTLASVTVLFLVVFNFFTVQSDKVVWAIAIGSVCLGLAFSYFLSNLLTLFVMILGGYMGYTAGIFLYNLILHFVTYDPQVVFWVTIVACVLIGALLSLKVAKHVMIVGTSLVGGYGVIRGASLYIGNFPNENTVIDLIKHKEWDQLQSLLNEYVYFYLAIWFVLFIAGLIAQYKINANKSSDDYKRIGSK